jgi:hypothetical protein
MTDETRARKSLAPDEAAKAEAEAEAAASKTARRELTDWGRAGSDDMPDRPGREPGELVVGLSPRQIIGGFALLAGLIIWLRRRGRRKG